MCFHQPVRDFCHWEPLVSNELYTSWAHNQWALSGPCIESTPVIPMTNYHSVCLHQQSVFFCCLRQFIIVNLQSRVEWSNVFCLIPRSFAGQVQEEDTIISFWQKHPEGAHNPLQWETGVTVSWEMVISTDCINVPQFLLFCVFRNPDVRFLTELCITGIGGKPKEDGLLVQSW